MGWVFVGFEREWHMSKIQWSLLSECVVLNCCAVIIFSRTYSKFIFRCSISWEFFVFLYINNIALWNISIPSILTFVFFFIKLINVINIFYIFYYNTFFIIKHSENVTPLDLNKYKYVVFQLKAVLIRIVKCDYVKKIRGKKGTLKPT